jgi:hypothetical protein
MEVDFRQDEKRSDSSLKIGVDNRPIFELMIRQRQGFWAKLTLLSISCRMLMFFLSILIILIGSRVFSIRSSSDYYFALATPLCIALTINIVWSYEMVTLLKRINTTEIEIFRLFEKGSQVEDAYIRSQRKEINRPDNSDLEPFAWMVLVSFITTVRASIHDSGYALSSRMSTNLVLTAALSLFLAVGFSRRARMAVIGASISLLIKTVSIIAFPVRIIYQCFVHTLDMVEAILDMVGKILKIILEAILDVVGKILKMILETISEIREILVLTPKFIGKTAIAACSKIHSLFSASEKKNK